MTNKSILAIFDFCGTLINMQTANPFILGLARQYPSLKRLALEIVRISLLKTGKLRGKTHKKFLLKQASGIHCNTVTNYAHRYLHEMLLPNENMSIVRKMKEHKELGHYVVIVSAGYENYISAYAKYHGIPNFAATKLEEKNSVLTGKILKNDCIGKEKLRRLSELLDLSSFNLQNSYAYSDHISDVPLLELVGNRMVIESGQDMSWCKDIRGKILAT